MSDDTKPTKLHPILDRLADRVASAIEGAVAEGVDEVKARMTRSSVCPKCEATNTTHAANDPTRLICLGCGHSWGPSAGRVDQIKKPGS